MMLAANFVLTLDNQSDQTVTLSAVPNPWKFDANGALSYRGAGTPLTVAPTAGNDGDTGSYDNSTNLDLGMHLDLTLTPGGTATGTCTVYLKPLNADQMTIALASYTFSASAAAVVLPAEI